MYVRVYMKFTVSAQAFSDSEQLVTEAEYIYQQCWCCCYCWWWW